MTKRAFLVVGPESSGTRLLTKILISAGCDGSAEHDQEFDRYWPTDEPLVVWRRSVPHGGHWPDLMGMVNVLRGKGYMVHAFVTTRDPFAMAHSSVNAGHVNNMAEAHERQTAAFAHIYQALGHVRCPSVMVPYEALVMRPKEVMRKLKSHFILPKMPRTKVEDGNAKHYE